MVFKLLGLLVWLATSGLQAEIFMPVNIQLTKIDAKRIDAKRIALAERFGQQQFNAIMAWLGVGTVAVGSLAGLAYLWNKHNQEADEVAGRVLLTDEQKKDFEARYYQHYLEDRRAPRSAGEYFDWILKNTNQAVLMTVCLSLSGLIVKKASFGWAKLTKKFDDLTGGQGPENYTIMTNKILNNTYQLYRSFGQLIDYAAAQGVSADDPLHQQLRLQLARNVMVDVMAFVDSVEETIAFTRELCEQADKCTDLAREQINQSTESLQDLTNQVLGRLEKSVQAAVCLNPDALAQADSLSKILYGLHGEFEYFIQMVRSMFYGDDYAINQAIIP